MIIKLNKTAPQCNNSTKLLVDSYLKTKEINPEYLKGDTDQTIPPIHYLILAGWRPKNEKEVNLCLDINDRFNNSAMHLIVAIDGNLDQLPETFDGKYVLPRTKNAHMLSISELLEKNSRFSRLQALPIITNTKVYDSYDLKDQNGLSDYCNMSLQLNVEYPDSLFEENATKTNKWNITNTLAYLGSQDSRLEKYKSSVSIEQSYYNGIASNLDKLQRIKKESNGNDLYHYISYILKQQSDIDIKTWILPPKNAKELFNKESEFRNLLDSDTESYFNNYKLWNLVDSNGLSQFQKFPKLAFVCCNHIEKLYNQESGNTIFHELGKLGCLTGIPQIDKQKNKKGETPRSFAKLVINLPLITKVEATPNMLRIIDNKLSRKGTLSNTIASHRVETLNKKIKALNKKKSDFEKLI